MRVNTVAINPNINPDFPDDAPDKMVLKIKELGIDFPYLVDETQQVADAFRAQCTPDIYLFDKNKALSIMAVLMIIGKMRTAVTREELKEAMNNMAAGRPISLNKSLPWVFH